MKRYNIPDARPDHLLRNKEMLTRRADRLAPTCCRNCRHPTGPSPDPLAWLSRLIFEFVARSAGIADPKALKCPLLPPFRIPPARSPAPYFGGISGGIFFLEVLKNTAISRNCLDLMVPAGGTIFFSRAFRKAPETIENQRDKAVLVSGVVRLDRLTAA